MELRLAAEVSEMDLPAGMISWYALNHEMNLKEAGRNVDRFRSLGLEFLPIDSTAGDGSITERMYDARAAALAHLNFFEGDPIICWLDSDLEFSALVPNGRGVKVNQPWPWLHMVWYHWLTSDSIDVVVGDVTGDSPVPASSTVLTNLRDMISNQNGEIVKGIRWEMRDPAYDLSELVRPEVNFPALPLNEWGSGIDKLEALLWKGTLNRPLVATENILSNPHRPWYVRGGVTVVYNRKVMLKGTPRFTCDGIVVRRGDSFWALKSVAIENYRLGQFPFPLLHRRTSFDGAHESLLESFQHRLCSDLIGAASLKGTVAWLDDIEKHELAIHLRIAIQLRTEKSISLLNEALKQVRSSNGALKMNDRNTLVTCIESSLGRIRNLDAVAASMELAEQISHYFEASDDV
jgi:hypothetical protein